MSNHPFRVFEQKEDVKTDSGQIKTITKYLTRLDILPKKDCPMKFPCFQDQAKGVHKKYPLLKMKNGDKVIVTKFEND